MAGISDPFANAIAVIIGAIMCFWGYQLSRIIASIAFGCSMSYLAFTYAFNATKSLAFSAIVLIVVLVIGLFIGFVFFRACIAVVFGYLLSKILIELMDLNNILILIALTVLFSIAMYVVAKYIMAIGFASTGAMLILRGLTNLGLDIILAFIIVVPLAILGTFNQLWHGKSGDEAYKG